VARSEARVTQSQQEVRELKAREDRIKMDR